MSQCFVGASRGKQAEQRKPVMGSGVIGIDTQRSLPVAASRVVLPIVHGLYGAESRMSRRRTGIDLNGSKRSFTSLWHANAGKRQPVHIHEDMTFGDAGPRLGRVRVASCRFRIQFQRAPESQFSSLVPGITRLQIKRNR